MTRPSPVTEEDIQKWHDSGEELFRYAKDIMGLEPGYVMCALSTAIAKTLLLSIPHDSHSKLDRHLEMIKSTILCEMLRIGGDIVRGSGNG
jgi:hypothetical protein